MTIACSKFKLHHFYCAQPKWSVLLVCTIRRSSPQNCKIWGRRHLLWNRLCFPGKTWSIPYLALCGIMVILLPIWGGCTYMIFIQFLGNVIFSTYFQRLKHWPKAKRIDFFNFSQGFVFGGRNLRLFTMSAKNFSCSRRPCSCLVRFAWSWLNGQLGFERLSKSCTMSGTGKIALSFKLCVTMVFRFAQRRPSEQWCWSSNDLCFSLWKSSDTRSPSLRREERFDGLFFWFENNFCLLKWSKKKGKQANTSLRPIVGSKKAEKKSPWVALEYTRTWVRSIKRRVAPAARSTGSRPPRDRGCEMIFETEGQDRRGDNNSPCVGHISEMKCIFTRKSVFMLFSANVRAAIKRWCSEG